MTIVGVTLVPSAPASISNKGFKVIFAPPRVRLTDPSTLKTKSSTPSALAADSNAVWSFIAGFNVSCVGDNRTYSYLPSRNGKTLSDKVVLNDQIAIGSDKDSIEYHACKQAAYFYRQNKINKYAEFIKENNKYIIEVSKKEATLQNKHYDFTKFDSIEFGRDTYEERPHSRKPGQLAEFYSTVTGTHNNETKKIGEFQIHFKSRLNIKFRFFSKQNS